MRNLLVFSLAIVGLTTTASAQQAVPVATRPTPGAVSAGDPTTGNVGNLADVNQQSNGRTTDFDAFVNQAGAGNAADIDQIASTSNSSTLRATADVQQTGNDNSAKIDQAPTVFGGRLTSNIDQDGARNVASVASRSENNDGQSRTTQQDQTGDDNEAFITTTGTRTRDAITQDQDGNRNYAMVNGSTGEGLGGTSGATLVQVQDGDDNVVEFRGNNQRTSGFGSENATIQQTQIGDGNTMYYSGSSNFGIDLMMTQTGGLNETYVTSAGEDSKITTTQTGDSNDIDASFSGFDRNTLTATQMGNLNNIDVIFSGADNTALVTQNGSGSSAIINQGN